MYHKLLTAMDFLRPKIGQNPKIGLVLGSGLGHFVDQLQDQIIIPYSEIPHFKPTSVEGHPGRLIVGRIQDTWMAVLQGRLHAYEGHDMEDIAFPVRVLATLGIEILILTNAAGGINTQYHPGDLVLIHDHINLMGKNPLVGPNITELGPRFPDMTEAYDRQLIQLFTQNAKEVGIPLKSGVYCSVLGPTYETPAEVRMIRAIGGDMVGMSTVPESIAANHLGLKVCGISCITNMAAGIGGEKLNHEDVGREAHKMLGSFSQLLLKTIPQLK